MEDIANVLAYEVKKEIADRYFSGRRNIEERIIQYERFLAGETPLHRKCLEDDLTRLRLLTLDAGSFRHLVTLLGVEVLLNASDRPDWLHTGTTEKGNESLLSDFKGKGLTGKRRYHDLARAIFSKMEQHLKSYRAFLTDLIEEREEICTEINQFSRNNDLSDILMFFHATGLSGNGGHPLQENNPVGAVIDLEKQLRFKLPGDVSPQPENLPNRLLPLSNEKEVKLLLDQVYRDNTSRIHATLPC